MLRSSVSILFDIWISHSAFSSNFCSHLIREAISLQPKLINWISLTRIWNWWNIAGMVEAMSTLHSRKKIETTIRQRNLKPSMFGISYAITRSWIFDWWRWETPIDNGLQLNISSRRIMVLLLGRKNCCVSAEPMAMAMASVLRWANWIFLLFIARMLFCPRFDVSRCSCCGRYLLLVEFHGHTGARQFTRRCNCQYRRNKHRHQHREFMFGIHIDGRTERKWIFVPVFDAPNDSIEFNYSRFAEKRRIPKHWSVRLAHQLTKRNEINSAQVWVALVPPSNSRLDGKNICVQCSLLKRPQRRESMSGEFQTWKCFSSNS